MACHCRRELTDTFSGGFSWQSSFGQGKWAAYNANFPATINLQYEIGGALSPRGCALLLYSISQLLPAITVNPHCPPHTKPLFTLHLSGVVQTPKTYDGNPESCVSSGAGRASSRGGDLQLAHCASVPWAGQQWHHEGHLFSSSHSHHFPVDPSLKCLQMSARVSWKRSLNGVWTPLSDVCFWCMWDVANRLNVHL